MPIHNRAMHKFTILIIPFIISYVAALSLSMGIRWVLEVKLYTNNIDKVLLDLWGPVIVSFIIFLGGIKKESQYL